MRFLKDKNDKKGLAHIEVIVSFLIFIGFVIFLFATLNPIRKTSVDNSIFDNVQYKIENDLGLDTELHFVSIILKDTLTKNCFNIPRIDDLENCNMGLIVKNAKGEIEGANIESSQILIDIKPYSDNRFHTIYCSEDISGNAGCSGATVDYELGVIQKQRFISYNKLENFINNLETDYDTKKETLGIPKGSDFALRLRDGQNILRESTTNAPSTTKVLSRSYPIRVLDSQATIKTYIIDILIW